MKNIAFLLLTAALAVLISSCEKKIPKATSEPENNSERLYKWADAANSSNPYEDDSSGYIHNDGLDYFIGERGNYSDANDFLADLGNLTLAYVELVHGSSLNSNVTDVVQDIFDARNSSPPSWVHESYLDTIFGTDGNAYLDSLEVILNKGYGSFSQYYNDLTDKEGIIENDGSLSTNCKRGLLNTYQVARYSLYYWMYWDPADYKRESILERTAEEIALIDARGFAIGYAYTLQLTGNMTWALAGGAGAAIVASGVYAGVDWLLDVLDI